MAADPYSAGYMSTPPPSGFPPGILIGGKFTILRLIAEGGVGAVYEAEDMLMSRRVALKLLHPMYAKHPEVQRRFHREAQATASIDHPNVVTIHEIGRRRDGTFFIAQELLRGHNLREVLVERGRLEVHEALRLLLPLSDALAAAHRKGIVHRDVKPENFVLARTASSEVVPKLIDFGIARMRPPEGSGAFTKIGVMLGTPAYMSPEQVMAESPVDGRSDVWSLAAVLFETLAGRPLFPGATDAAVLAKILTTPAARLHDVAPSVPRILADIVASAFERDPENRPTMHAFRDALLAFLDSPGRSAVLSAGHAEEVVAGADTELLASSLDDLVELGAEDLQSVDEEWLAGGNAASPFATTQHPEIEWAQDGSSLRPEMGALVSLAEDALRINALEDTIRRAEEAIGMGVPSDALMARLRLMQSIALFWLGHNHDAELFAQEAMERSPIGTTGWYAALGHIAMAAGQRGSTEHLESLGQQLLRVVPNDGAAAVVAACRLAVQMVRSGFPERARQLLDAHERTSATLSSEPFVRAWVAVARGELAAHEGDPMRYMELVKASVDDFVAAGDIRNASLQRSNIGNAYLQLGGYRQAERVLDEALVTAEPMKLSFAAAIRVNLGFALARLGNLEQALDVETTAVQQCIRQGNRRFQSVAQIYLALIHTARGELDLAEGAAEAAVVIAERTPALRAYALAVLASLLLNQDRHVAGFRAAREATSLLSQLDGVEEGESLIRLVNALAFAQGGKMKEAALVLQDAQARLMDRAARITDARWRESFLRHVPENAQTLSLAGSLKHG